MYAQVDDSTHVHNDLVAVMKENSVKSDNPFQKLFYLGAAAKGISSEECALHEVAPSHD